MISEFVAGERRSAAGSQSNGRAGIYGEVIVNDVGLGRYFEAGRNGRLFCLSCANASTLNANATPIAAAGTPVWALFNPPSNNHAAVILKASCILIAGASATPIIPVWNVLTDLTGMTALGTQTSGVNVLTSAILSTTGNPGTMRSFTALALTGGTVAFTFFRNWMGSFNDPRHAGAASETSAGVLVEETEGSIILPPGVILAVAFSGAGAAITGSVSVIYAEIDWPLL